MSIRIASCEDNKSIRETIVSYFEKIKQEKDLNFSVDFFVNGENLIYQTKRDYDIIVLDIEMGESNLNGMQIAQRIREYDDEVTIIFLTKEKKYLKEGYKVRAYRYLIKPVSYEEFKDAVCDGIKYVHKRRDRYLDVTGYSKYNKILIDDIYYIETHKRKTMIHTSKGDIECSYSITELTEKLENKKFYRCYNSYLINLEYVDYYDSHIVRIQGVEIPLSRNKIEGLRDRMYQIRNRYDLIIEGEN